MLEDDKAVRCVVSERRGELRSRRLPSVHERGVAENALESRELVDGSLLTARDVPIVGVEGTTRSGRPEDWPKAQRVGDCADTVVLDGRCHPQIRTP